MNMLMMGRRAWTSGANIGTIYHYDHAQDADRIGHCAWLPNDGDLCLCVEHSGDSFYDYFALRLNDNGKLTKVGEFGAYVFGRKVGKLEKRQFH